MTIHRDLDALESCGLLRKVRGNATIRSDNQSDGDYRFRERLGGAAKASIAQAALELIEPGMVMITNNAAVIDTLRAEAGIAPEITTYLSRASSAINPPFLFGSPFGTTANATFMGLRGWHDRYATYRTLAEALPDAWTRLNELETLGARGTHE